MSMIYLFLTTVCILGAWAWRSPITHIGDGSSYFELDLSLGGMTRGQHHSFLSRIISTTYIEYFSPSPAGVGHYV